MTTLLWLPLIFWTEIDRVPSTWPILRGILGHFPLPLHVSLSHWATMTMLASPFGWGPLLIAFYPLSPGPLTHLPSSPAQSRFPVLFSNHDGKIRSWNSLSLSLLFLTWVWPFEELGVTQVFAKSFAKTMAGNHSNWHLRTKSIRVRVFRLPLLMCFPFSFGRGTAGEGRQGVVGARRRNNSEHGSWHGLSWLCKTLYPLLIICFFTCSTYTCTW